MARVKHAVATKKRHKKVLKEAKGQWGARGTHYRLAKETIQKGMMYAFRDRRRRKREFRRLWITRVSSACKQRGLSYSRFIKGLLKANIAINRKMLAELAISDPKAFDKIVEIASAK